MSTPSSPVTEIQSTLQDGSTVNIPHSQLKSITPATIDSKTASKPLKQQLIQLIKGEESTTSAIQTKESVSMPTLDMSPDELFLDIVVTAAIITLGYDVRGNFKSWENIEKFIHLFVALYNGWRTLIHFFSVSRVASGFLHKFGVYAVFTSITGVAIGAFRSRSSSVRPFVGVSSFSSTAIPAIASILRERKAEYTRNTEEENKTPSLGTNQIQSTTDENFEISVLHNQSSRQERNICTENNQSTLPQSAKKGNIKISLSTVMSGGYLISAIPYLITTFVHNPIALRVLHWIPIVTNLAVSFLAKDAHEFFFVDGKKALSDKFSEKYAVSYQTRKYDGLTTLLQGELSLLLLLEGAILLATDGVRVNLLYASAAACTAMIYALQMLYNQVDNKVEPSGTHALDCDDVRAILWTQLHIPYHAVNVLFATGLAIAIREIAIPDHNGLHFNKHERWLFSGAWGTSMLLSALIGSLHKTKSHTSRRVMRILARTVFVLALSITMPFTKVSSAWFLLAFLITMIVWVLVEVTVVYFEVLRIERRVMEEAATKSSSNRVVP